MGGIAKSKKVVFIAIGVVLAIAVIVAAVIIGGKMKEEQETKETAQAFQAENLLGLWTVAGEDYSFLIYMDKDRNCHLRTNIFYDTDSRTNMFDMEAIVWSGYLATKSSGGAGSDEGDKVTMMPLNRPNNDNNSFEVYFNYKNQGDELTNDENIYDTHLVIERDVAFDKYVDLTMYEYSSDILDTIIRMINKSCSSYYGQEISVVDLKFEEDRLAGSPVDYNGFISGTGMIAGVDNSTLQLNTTYISFSIDPVEKGTLRIHRLSNTSRGEHIIWDYKSEK